MQNEVINVKKNMEMVMFQIETWPFLLQKYDYFWGTIHAGKMGKAVIGKKKPHIIILRAYAVLPDKRRDS